MAVWMKPPLSVSVCVRAYRLVVYTVQCKMVCFPPSLFLFVSIALFCLHRLLAGRRVEAVWLHGLVPLCVHGQIENS